MFGQSFIGLVFYLSSEEEYQYFANFMTIALEEAKQSLREGNKGFGSVLVRDGAVVDRSHDTAVTDNDPTAHAEIKLIRAASGRDTKHNLEGCMLVTTHEPCPMCMGAAIWARVPKIVYGTSIEQSKKLGRMMIDLRSEEIANRAPWKTEVVGGILADQCSRFYDASVRKLVERFRVGGPASWKITGEELAKKRVTWFSENKDEILAELKGANDVERAYDLILTKIGIAEEEAPVVERSENRMVFHSQNPCPALDACNILGLDTRVVCRLHTEGATDKLIKQINPKLKFGRNYSKLRPSSEYCEEIIELEE